jgi:hypothetical protein
MGMRTRIKLTFVTLGLIVPGFILSGYICTEMGDRTSHQVSVPANNSGRQCGDPCQPDTLPISGSCGEESESAFASACDMHLYGTGLAYSYVENNQCQCVQDEPLEGQDTDHPYEVEGPRGVLGHC